MLRQTEMTHTEPGLFLKTQQTVRDRRELILPALRTPKTDALRESQKEEIEALIPQTANLRNLIADIPASYAEEFASVIGSVDFPQDRLAKLLAGLEKLADDIDQQRITTPDQIKDAVKDETRIHTVFEDLVIRCALNSL